MGTHDYPLRIPSVLGGIEEERWAERISENLPITVQDSTTTTDANGQTVLAVQLSPATVYAIESWCLGVLQETTNSREIGSSELHIWHGGAKLDINGNAVLIGAGASQTGRTVTTTISDPADQTTWTTALTVSGNKIAQNAQGDAGDVVKWVCKMRIFQVSL